MPHQDQAHLRKNLDSIKAVLGCLLSEEVGCFPRHGNAKLEPSWLAAVAMVCWDLTTGLPVRWKVTGGTGSERKSVAELLEELPANARLIGDAEYVGYPLWTAIIESGRSFLFRIGSNVTFLKNLGRYRLQDG